MENCKKCIHCGEPIIDGHHVVAEVGYVKYVSCYESRRIEKETSINKSLAKYLVKFHLHGYTEQKGA